MADNGPSILIIDPALLRRAGHHFNAARRLQGAAVALGGQAEILCARGVDTDILRELGARAVFRDNTYLRRTFDRAEFDRMTGRTLADLVTALSPSRFAPDLILLPTCDQILAKALAGYLRFSQPHRMPGVAAWIVLPPELMAKNADDARRSVESQIPEISEGFGALAVALGGGRLKLFCETEKLAAFYADATRLPVEIMACPSVASTLAVAERTGPIPMIVALGHLNRGKGYEVLPVAIDRALAAGIEARFVIHAACPPDNLANQRLLGLLSETSDRVQVRSEDLSEQAYAELLRAADLVMLPYDPAVYGERGSGVFNEAESLGIPTIVTRGCSFADAAVSAGRSVAAEAYTGEAVAAAILKAVRGIAELRARQRISSATDRKSASGAPLEAALARLLKAPQPKEAGANRRGLGRTLHCGLAEGRHLEARADRLLRDLLGPAAWRRRLGAVRRWLSPAPGDGKNGLERRAWVADLLGDPAWDAAAPLSPRVRYVIAAMHRSGSNLMVRQLFRAGAGLPAEYFHPQLTRPLLARWGLDTLNEPTYLDRLFTYRQSVGGVWGAKLHWEHVEALDETVTDRLFPGSKVIFTRRRNLAMQALSYARALHSGRWDPRWSADPQRRDDIETDNLDQLFEIAVGLVEVERKWVRFFERHGLEVREVCYEDYLADQDRTHQEVFEFLGVKCGPPRLEVPPTGRTGDRSEDQPIAARLSGMLDHTSVARPPFQRTG